VKVILVSTYDLGHQPFGLASPKAWLAAAGHDVHCVDLAVDRLPEDLIRGAGLVAFHLPMHTATRMAVPVIARVKALNPKVRLACYGLYAPLNAELLADMGVDAIAGGEYEPRLVALANGAQAAASGSSAPLATEPLVQVSLDRLAFRLPDRTGLPEASRYSHLRDCGVSKTVAYTEASRGCKHLCRHCPVVPVYEGQFRVVQRDIVLADIRQQVTAGATHVTFGDPDFFNGPTHALRLVEAFHHEFPELTYDATIKIEHLLKHRDLLPALHDTGCLFITSAVESVDDAVLAKLEKNHTRRDFLEAVELTRAAGLALQPTFIAFMPWTTRSGFVDLLRVLADLDIVENVGPVQLALRLLITSGSRLLELDDIRALVGPFDAKRLVYPWKHSDPEMDSLAGRILQLVNVEQKKGRSRTEIFAAIWAAATSESLPAGFSTAVRPEAPHMDEPWYCCAEPMDAQVPLV